MHRRPINYPLWLGGIISALIMALAIWGPRLAPHDPMAEVPQFFYEGRLYAPPPIGRPLPPFTHPDYPLGHDDINRDVLSRLMWAVRPTLILCAIVVSVRIALGVLLGLLAGWFGGMAARAVDALTSLSAAVPLLALVVALILGLSLSGGLLSFVVALSIVGWIDAAAIIRNRAITLQGAPYIESARAIGIAPGGILWRHVLPQLWPILPVLMIFELSAVLLLVAELGYLGYFVGGGYVYETRISDFGPPLRLIRSGYPELGQMLSGFFRQLYHTPWVSISAGALVFVSLTGFTLLGEGLRRAMDVTRPRRASRWRRLRESSAGAGESFAR